MITRPTVVKTFLFILFLCVAMDGFTQKNFKPGYIVTNAGDTVKGQIDDLEWETNPNSILFKIDVDQRWYGISDIRSFGILNGNEYMRAVVSYHEGVLDITKRDPDHLVTIKIDTLFLRTLVKGKNSLYEITTPERPYFFISDNGSAPTELIAGLTKLNDGSIVRDKTYMETLYAIATKQGRADELKFQIENTLYTESRMIKVVKLLNGRNGSIAPQNIRAKTSAFEIGVGLAYSAFHLSQGKNIGNFVVYNILNAASMKASISPDLEAAVLLGNRREFSQIKARISIAYSSLTFQGDGDPAMAPTAYISKESYYARLNLLKPGAGVVFITNPYSKNKFYFNAGVDLMLAIGDATITRTSTSALGATTIHRDYPALRTSASDGNLGIGIMMDRSRVDLKGEYSIDLSRNSATDIRAIRFVLGYHYALTKF